MSNHERESSRTPAGDTALDRAWHEVSDEQPPPALDAAIIAAAHKPTQGRNEQAQVTRVSPPQRTWLARWQPLAAAAAVAGLAFVLVQSLPRDQDVAPSMRIEEPAPGRATAQKEMHAPPTGDTSDAKAVHPSESAVAPEPSATADRALTQMADPAPAEAAPSAAVPPSLNSVTATDVADAATGARAMRDAEFDQRTETTAEARSGIASAEVAAPAQERRQNAQTPLSATERAARIAAFYASGHTADAAAALREFRAVDPHADTYLPDSLRDWARTVE